MKMPPFEYACPATLSEAVNLLAAREDAKALAGGQSLMPMLAFRLSRPSLLVDLRKLVELCRIDITESGISIGAMTRWRDIENDARLRTAHPLLVDAVAHIAHYQIRNRGTVGGSIAHADPAAEMPGIAITCDATISVVGKAGPRDISAKDFFIGPLTTTLEADEIVVKIHLPAWEGKRRWGFEEFARRRGDFAMAAAAVFYDEDSNGRAHNAHVGVIGVADRPLRLSSVEEAINGQVVNDVTIARAESAASASIDPDDDIHASNAYRCALIGTMVERALLAAVRR